MKHSEKPGRIAIVTGGSNGIGKATAKALSLKGYKVYEFSRRGTDYDDITHVTADVTDEKAVAAAVGEVLSREGRVDLLVNNAGFGISGATEFTSTEDAKRLFDADFFGTFNVIRAVVPAMRKQGGGRIINLSSVASLLSIPYQVFYSAAKASVNTLTLGLANELKPFGISVCAVMPGDVKTGFTAAREKTPTGDDVYGGRISRSVAVMEKDETNGMPPEFIAKRIVSIAGKKNVKPLYSAGFKYQFFCVLARILPFRLSNSIVGSLYNK